MRKLHHCKNGDHHCKNGDYISVGGLACSAVARGPINKKIHSQRHCTGTDAVGEAGDEGVRLLCEEAGGIGGPAV